MKLIALKTCTETFDELIEFQNSVQDWGGGGGGGGVSFDGPEGPLKKNLHLLYR